MSFCHLPERLTTALELPLATSYTPCTFTLHTLEASFGGTLGKGYSLNDSRPTYITARSSALKRTVRSPVVEQRGYIRPIALPGRDPLALIFAPSAKDTPHGTTFKVKGTFLGGCALLALPACLPPN